MSGEILVTGATGFVGRHLASTLQKEGMRVRTFSLEDGDIASARLPAAGVSHIFHLAARVYVPDSWLSPREFYETNVLGTLNVLECGRLCGASVTFVSSYVYGIPERLPVSEDHPLEAVNPYSHTKILAEDVCRFYHRVHQVPVTILRPFNLYGPGQDRRFLIPSIVDQALNAGTPVIEVADERPKRDYIYVHDFVALLRASLGHRGGVFNAGSGVSTSPAELVDLINELAGVNKPLVSRGETRLGEIPDVVADVSKAARELGWRPVTPLREGVAAVLAQARERRRD